MRCWRLIVPLVLVALMVAACTGRFAPPQKQARPKIAVDPSVGQVLHTTNGVWTNNPFSFAYQWQRCSGACSNIPGATSNSYTVASADVGNTIDVVVTATNAGGSASQTSAQTTVVTAGGLPAGVTLQQIDGGTTYFASHGFTAASSFDSPNFFPISAFDQTLGYNSSTNTWDPANLAAYHNVGVNGFISLYNGYNSAMASAIAADGMWLFDGPSPGAGAPLAGSQWFDEADGINQCGNMPSASVLGETVPCSTGFYGGAPSASQIAQVTADLHGAKGKGDPTRPVYGNYTGGNTAQHTPPDANVQAYVNAVDVVSYDDYIITGGYSPDHNLWRQYNDMRQMRQEANYSHPVWAYIEAGNPESSNSWSGITPTPAMETAEAWNLLIGGARGISWFDHAFCSCAGAPQSSDTLIDPNSYWAPLQAAVKAWNAEVQALAPQLNDPFANGYVSSSVTGGNSMNVMAKYDAMQNSFYVFAAPRFNSGQTATYTTASSGYSGPVTVYGENRTVSATNGVFSDSVAGQTAVHIYVVPNA